MASTIVSWGLTLVLIGAAAYYYNPKLFTSLFPQSPPVQSKATPIESASRPPNKRAKSSKAKKNDTKVGDEGLSTASNSSGVTSKKRKIASDSTTQAAPKIQPTFEENVDDKEFAAQLARTQAGTKLQKPASQSIKSKGQKAQQSQDTQTQVTTKSAETSSATERDTDDEASSANPPPTAISNVQGQPARAGDVSDMLEAPAARPQTLRLTGVSTENKPKKPAAKLFEPVMSKKQRQQQAKKDEMRQMREESDRIHEAKKQQQLRGARMAEGTSNQSKVNNFSANTGNAWTEKNKDAVKAPPAESAPLLDTFDPSSISTTTPHGAVHTASLEESKMDTAADLKEAAGVNKASAMAASSREGPAQSWSDEMSEQEQLKLLKQEDAWEDVTSKKTKRKTPKENDAASENSKSIYNLVTAQPQTNGVKTNGVKTNGLAARPETSNRFDSFQTNDKSALADADWEA